MTGEEFFKMLDELNDNLGDFSYNEIKRRVAELSDYAKNNKEVLNEKLEKKDSVVYGDIQADSNEPKDIILSNLDKNIMQEDYFDKLKEKVVKEKLEETKENENNDSKEIEDSSKYITGTKILKPRDRGILESDEDYVKYLEDYYSKVFPNKDNKDVIDDNAPKSLATLSDVKEPEEIVDLKNILNKKDEEGVNFESRNIYSDSSKKAKSILSDDEDDKSEVIDFGSEEEKKAFEKAQEIDYKEDADKKTKKIDKIKKSLGKFRKTLKKHGKKIIAGLLVAAAAIGSISAIKGCTYDKQDLKENKDDPKINTDEYKTSIPSVTVADSFGAKKEEALDIEKDKKTDTKITDSDKLFVDEKAPYTNSTDKETFNVDDFNIGEAVHFDGNKIYETANDAASEKNGLNPYFSNDDNREISLIHFVSPDGKEEKTAHNSKEAEALRKDGWKELAYNVKNVSHNTNYEGWTKEISKVK